MTELIISRGDTFPRSFLDTYRANRASEQFYNDLTSSKSDELVLQNSVDIQVSEDIHHGHSENLLDTSSLSSSATKDNFLDKAEIILPKSHRRRVPVYDRVDPEDSIRDIVTENDFYRFVLFKKHYDKYLHLSQKYEEARNIAYYLEEKYHEVKMERDDLIQQRDQLTKRLESNESLLREKEDEVFLQFERVVYLEEQCDKLKAEKEKCHEQKEIIEKERDKALEFPIHINVWKYYYNIYLNLQNDQLKEALEAERKGMERYLIQVQRRRAASHVDYVEKQEDEVKLAEHSSDALTSQFQKAVQHLATCRQKKCSVCAYTKSTYRKITPHNRKYDRKLFGCLQTPFLEMRNMIKPPPSPIHGEGESLSEWFCHMSSTVSESECSSLSIPFAELSISYMDDGSDTSSNYLRDSDKDDQDVLSNINYNNIRGYGSDSGFSSDICGDYKSNATTPKEKFCPNAILDEAECAKLTRTKWTASFRKLIRRIKK
ncbi:hypothetical protein NQ314_001604 [Rhamnusium bicolor]|uniref:Uncharacterized protein n=1 Tax=Rhamnusium bicolor TaxID=1586634 RepID=A0AAV8ZTQ7_9CUCU|nr:hypothetical protein NQ314_001604 [Rhamnusium bicolor]